MSRITTTIVTTALVACAQLACAANPIDDSHRHVVVHFADLNLNTTEGTAALYRRVRGAAQNVCSERGTRDLGSLARVKACESAAVSAAITQIDKPVLAAYYRAQLMGINAAVLRASR
jgi:UrcA family protein